MTKMIHIFIASLLLASCKNMEISKGDLATPEPTKKESIPTKKESIPLPLAWNSHKDAATFTKHLSEALDKNGQGMLAMATIEDHAEICPNYPKLTVSQRKDFYMMLVSWMAKRESSFKTEAKYAECSTKKGTYKDEVYNKELNKYCMKSSSGEPIVSRGLLQISYSSANGYGCKIAKDLDLHDPKTNLECSVKILNHLITKDKVVSKTTPRLKDGQPVYDKNGKPLYDHFGGARYWSVLRKKNRSKPEEPTSREVILANVNKAEICKPK